MSHAEYVAECDEAQLNNLIEQANKRLEALRQSGWVHLWTVVVGWCNVAWFALEEYDAAVEYMGIAIKAEAAKLPAKGLEVELSKERYRPEEAAALLARKRPHAPVVPV